MKYCRFLHNGKAFYGHIEESENCVVGYDKGYLNSEKMFEAVPLSEVKILAPVQPSKIVAAGLNFYAHANEIGMGVQVKPEPVIFLKPPSSVIGSGDEIVYPYVSERLDYEAELAFVISADCKNISEKDAESYILGYTCLNDVTCRDLQKTESQWTRCKGFDTFCPVGPCIVSGIDVSDLKIQAVLNGRVVQDSSTSQMIHSPAKLLSCISSIMTLNQGDVIACGTPEGIGPMERGDVIEVKIQNIGTLRNVVKV